MNKIIVLLGPTGVGKTGASILLAKELGAEIISADSMQIYRHMDIGTAKPSEKERDGVIHHMIDIVDPSEAYSAGRYIADVTPVVERLIGQGRVPVIVGGTGLYIKAMTRGIFSGPSSDPELRERLLAMEKQRKGALCELLVKLDPEAAGRIEQNDVRRLIRAIEVCEKSSMTISDMQRDHTRPMPYDFVKIGLTRDRKELYRMIDSRVDEMLRAGLVEEVMTVLGMRTDMTPLQAIGYREIIRHLNNEIDLQESVRLIKRNSRRYAKRQYTWFRQEEDIRWVDVTGLHDSLQVLQAIKQALSLPAPEAPETAKVLE